MNASKRFAGWLAVGLVLSAGVARAAEKPAPKERPTELASVSPQEIMTPEEVRRILIESNSLSYATNAVGADGVATGKPDPVLLRAITNPMPTAEASNTDEQLASR